MSHVANAARRIVGPAIPTKESMVSAIVSRTMIFPKNNDGDRVIAPNIKAIQGIKLRSKETLKTNKARKNCITKTQYLKRESANNWTRNGLETRIKSN